MLFVIIGHDTRDAKEKRPVHRAAHVAHLEGLARAGKIVLAGPLTDGAGSLIVVEADSAGAVWEIVGRDPYVANGVFERVEVHPFLQVLPTP
ncbi:MAG: YciI family protein [Candidatus Binatia bacterium]